MGARTRSRLVAAVWPVADEMVERQTRRREAAERRRAAAVRAQMEPLELRQYLSGATFVGTDAVTQGSWMGTYGADGHSVINDANSFPSYASVSVSGNSTWTWNSSTSAAQALQYSSGVGRLAAISYSSTNFTENVDITDGNTHAVSIYVLDWDSLGRDEQIQVLDHGTSTVLDSETVSSFAGGKYLTWNVSGNVDFKFINLAGSGNNAGLSGMFFEGQISAPSAPTGVSATGLVGFNTVSWSATSGATSYNLYRGTSTGSESLYQSGLTSTSYTDTGVTTGTTYYYKVSAVDRGDEGSLSSEVSATVQASTATFVDTDSTTQGSWIGNYGSNGYNIIGDASSYPSYASVSVTGNSAYTWNSSTSAPQALQYSSGSGRLASLWYSSTNFTVNVNLTDGQTHAVSLYVLDWDNIARSEQIQVIDASTSTVLDSETVSSFSGGKYLTWNVSGNVQFKITNLAGSGNNGGVSGLFFGPSLSTPSTPTGVSATGGTGLATVSWGAVTGATSYNLYRSTSSGSETLYQSNLTSTSYTDTAVSGGTTYYYKVTAFDRGEESSLSSQVSAAVLSPSATFVQVDSATQGDWVGTYGSTGYAIVNDTASLPSYASISASGESNYTWNGWTTDTRATHFPTGSGGIAASWYSSTNFTANVDFTDGNTHAVTLYVLDWDNMGRSEQIQVIDHSTSAVLDTETVSSFAGGKYLSWNVSGNVDFKFTNLAGSSTNAGVSGFFIDPQLPTLATAASASPNPATGPTSSLSVLGAYGGSGGESSLTYTWSVLSKPAGASDPTFSANGTNAAKNSTVTFASGGVYTFQARITDPTGQSIVSDVSVSAELGAFTGSGDIGSPTVAGSSTYSSGVYNLSGGGTGIGGSGDQFQYVYTPMTGNGSMTVRIASFTPETSGAQVGIMFRNSLGTDANEAFVSLNGGGGTEFITRTGTDAITTYGPLASGAQWLQLTREGGEFSAYISSDGVHWTQIASSSGATSTQFGQFATSLSMGSTIYVGLAITGASTSVASTATADNVTINASSTIVPTNVLAYQIGGTAAIVDWQNPADYTGTYNVYDSTDGTTWTLAGTSSSGDTGMEVKYLQPATQYYFAVGLAGNVVMAPQAVDMPDASGLGDYIVSASELGWESGSQGTYTLTNISFPTSGEFLEVGAVSWQDALYKAFDGDQVLVTYTGGATYTYTFSPTDAAFQVGLPTELPGPTPPGDESLDSGGVTGPVVAFQLNVEADCVPPFITSCVTTVVCDTCSTSTSGQTSTTADAGVGSGSSNGGGGASTTIGNTSMGGNSMGQKTYNAYTPYATQAPCDSTVTISYSATDQEQFVANGDGTYSPTMGNKSTLVDNTTSHKLILTDPSGNQTMFNDFTSAADKQGKFVSDSNPGGGMTSVVGTDSYGNPEELQVSQPDGSGTLTTQEFLYTYTTVGLTEYVSSVEQIDMSSPDTPVRTTTYTYYSTGDANGNSGDLESITLHDGGADGAAISTDYFRYYISGPQDNLLEYEVESDSFARLAAAVGSDSLSAINAASNTVVARYADEYLQYDDHGRVITQTVQGEGCSVCTGGQGTYTYTYDVSGNTLGYNNWTFEQTQTLPDGNANITYANVYNQTMLSVFQDNTTDQQWDTYTQYDDAGHVILTAQPSAVTGFNDADADLGVTLSADSGLIDTTSYYMANTATGTALGDQGGAAGYQYQTFVRDGSAGTPILQSTTDYFEASAGGTTIFPVADSTQYRVAGPAADASSDLPQTTSYFSTYYAGTVQPYSTTTILPSISTGQNGPGGTYVIGSDGLPQDHSDGTGNDISTEVFDTNGRVIWTQDGDGYLNYTAYDQYTGAVIKTVTDVNTSGIADSTEAATLPFDWSTPAGGGVNLTTTYEVDSLGRTTEMTDPNGNATYMVYDDPDQAVFTFPGATESLDGEGNGTLTTTGPITMTRTRIPYSYVFQGNTVYGTYDETMTLTGTVTVTDYKIILPGFITGTDSGVDNVLNLIGDGSSGSPQYTIQTLARNLYNFSGQDIEHDAYFNLDNATYLATDVDSPYSGSLNTNYYATTFAYNERGWLDHIEDPTGTSTDTAYDALGRIVATYVGTDDVLSSGSGFNGANGAAGNNMVETETFVYDNGEVGDGNLTQKTQYPGGSAASRVSNMIYDFRDRQIASQSGVGDASTFEPIVFSVYDNLDEVTASYEYDGEGIALSDFADATMPPSGDAANLRALTVTSFDDQGRIYQSEVYSIDPTDGDIGDALTTETFYDHRGDVIETIAPTGQATKMSYDGAGRETIMSITDGGVINNPSTAGTWAAAGSLTGDVVVDQTAYGYDGDNNIVETDDGQRFHNDPNSATGALFTATTNSDGSLDITPASSSDSSLGARLYYTTSYFDAANRKTADVNVGDNGGLVYTRPSDVPARTDNILINSYTYNDAGWVDTTTDPRSIVTKTLYDDLGRTTSTIIDYTDGTPTSSTNQTTDYTYDGNGNVQTMTAVMPSGTPSQTTQYVYGVTTSGGSDIDSNDLLAKTEYPDFTTGDPSTSGQVVTYSYNALGQQTSMTDRNGTVHAYTYDALGRLTSDAVTVASGNPENVDTSVVKLGYTYNSQGLAYQQTSYNGSDGVVNQVEDVYNGLGQLTNQYQSHSGAVNTSTTLGTKYTYSDPSNGSRLAEMIYPDGRILHYGYDNSTLDDAIGRVDFLANDNGSGGVGAHTVDYSYLGLSTIVIDADGNGNSLTYVKQGSESDGDGGDQYTGLDRFGRVVDQRWINSSGDDVDRYEYTYDRDGNVTAKVNVLNGSLDETYTYDSLNRLTDAYRDGTLYGHWDLDALGNWLSVTLNGVTTTNTYNAQNQYNGTSYDANGSLLTDPSSGDHYVYDAWNRLVTAKNSGDTTIAIYTYDAQGWRITETYGSTTADVYYSAGWQVIEEDQGVYVTDEYVWGLGYVDDLVERDSDLTTDGGLRLYAQQDANWNVTSLASSGGMVAERFVYDPYGQNAVRAADWTSTTDTYSWLYLFQGGRIDTATGLYNFRNRDYSTTLGRWTQEDPANYVDGANLFQYVDSSPIGRSDPSGLCGACAGWTVDESNVTVASLDAEVKTPLFTDLARWVQRFYISVRHEPFYIPVPTHAGTYSALNFQYPYHSQAFELSLGDQLIPAGIVIMGYWVVFFQIPVCADDDAAGGPCRLRVFENETITQPNGTRTYSQSGPEVGDMAPNGAWGIADLSHPVGHCKSLLGYVDSPNAFWTSESIGDLRRGSTTNRILQTIDLVDGGGQVVSSLTFFATISVNSGGEVMVDTQL